MFFKIVNNTLDTPDEKIKVTWSIAYSRILRFPMGATDIALENYLQNKYKKTLKQICKELLLYKIVFNSDVEQQNIFVSFKTTKDNDLAALITYGNSEIKGSHILQFAFDQKF